MVSSVESMRKMKAEEENDRVVKVGCDVLRTLLVLGGTGWQDELNDGLAAIAAAQDDSGWVASSSEVENALKFLKEKRLVDYRKGKRASPSGGSMVDDNLYSLVDYTATMQAFGADKSVILLRRRE